MHGVELALADGVNAVARAIVEGADPPDAAPYGVGLVTRGGWLTYIGDKKIDGGSTSGRQPKKPRSFRVKGTVGIVAIAGFSFPGRFQEFGTVHQAAKPFLAPARDRVVPHVDSIMKRNASYRLARIR
ncbi:MAG TPA: hypothetical protein VI341_13590 [Actinomycetota bacterium]